MRMYPVILLCLITVAVPLAQTVGIHSEPSGLPVWYRGELVGDTPYDLVGPFSDPVIFTVRDGEREITTRIDLPIEEDITCYVSMTETPPLGAGTTILGFFAGAAAGYFLASIVKAIFD